MSEPYLPKEPPPLVERLRRAMNAHDLEAFVGCFAPDYESVFPAHPDRGFRGRDLVRHNWARIFTEIPDLNATLMRCSEDDETLWTEWEWTGTLSNGASYLMRGVVIIGAREEHVTWARLYTETVERDEGADRIGSLLRRGSAQPASPSSTDE